MAIRVEERFEIRAPVASAWAFLVDPRRVVGCVPGGELEEVLDERTFHGRVRIRIAGVELAFRGRVRLDEVDVAGRRVRIVGEAREGAAGSVRLVLDSWITARPDGGAAVVALASAEAEGRIVRLWRGPLESLAHELFRDFSGCVAGAVEAEEARRTAGLPPAPPAAPRPPLRAIPLALRALRAWLGGLVGRARAGDRPR